MSFLYFFSLRDVFDREPDTLKSFLLQDTLPDHILSAVYRVLIVKLHPHLPEFTNKWTLDLNVQIKSEEWEKAFTLTHCMPPATKAHETNFKLLSCWYRCLTLLHRIYQNVSDLCWRCQSSKGSLLHIWWECPPVYDFWGMILQLYTCATVPNMPQISFAIYLTWLL